MKYNLGNLILLSQNLKSGELTVDFDIFRKTGFKKAVVDIAMLTLLTSHFYGLIHAYSNLEISREWRSNCHVNNYFCMSQNSLIQLTGILINKPNNRP